MTSDDERVAEHMLRVKLVKSAAWAGGMHNLQAALSDVEASARALLATPRRRLSNDEIDAIADSIMEPCDSGDAAADDLDRVVLRRFARAAIRAAMKEAK